MLKSMSITFELIKSKRLVIGLCLSFNLVCEVV